MAAVLLNEVHVLTFLLEHVLLGALRVRLLKYNRVLLRIREHLGIQDLRI